MTASCAFCEIVAGRATASFVHQDREVVTFMDLHPITPGHLLVVPRTHAPLVRELDESLSASLWGTALRMAEALRGSGLRCEGVNFFLADGEAAGQEVFHAHLHVLPRFAGDGFGLRFPPGYGPPAPREALDEVARRVRAALG